MNTLWILFGLVIVVLGIVAVQAFQISDVSNKVSGLSTGFVNTGNPSGSSAQSTQYSGSTGSEMVGGC
ncbi:MAG: hypothetical protein HZB65_01645 [Candidatus Aenigmarchaeota archaeon]|nr:hypothetical protein [Candidatus Aenigmarchaeota archaeon]